MAPTSSPSKREESEERKAKEAAEKAKVLEELERKKAEDEARIQVALHLYCFLSLP